MNTMQKAIGIMLGLIIMTTVLGGQPSYKLHVDGLSCPFCAYGIEKKLGAIKGVQRTEVDIASGAVTVTMAENAALDEAAAKKAVKEAGFSLRSFEEAQAASQSQPKNKP